MIGGDGDHDAAASRIGSPRSHSPFCCERLIWPIRVIHFLQVPEQKTTFAPLNIKTMEMELVF